MATERVLSNLNLISFKTEGGLQNHIDELQDGDLVFTPDSSLKGTLLDYKWADHLLNDMSWLRADTFSWQSGDVYVAAYNHLVADFEGAELKRYYAWVADSGYVYYSDVENVTNGRVAYMYNNGKFTFDPYIYFNVSDGAVSVGVVNVTRDASKDKDSIVNSNDDTFGDTTITYYRAEDGHKICLPNQEDALLELYNKTGVAWYYILDTENKQFKLPRRHSQQIVRSVKNADGSWYRLYADGWVEQGGFLDELGSTDIFVTLPIVMANINYTVTTSQYMNNATGQYVFIRNEPETTRLSLKATNTIRRAYWQVSGQSAIDTSSLQDSEKHLYFYVGNFERDAVEQTAGIAAEMFNGKADVSRVEVLEGYDYVVESQLPTEANGYTWYRKYKSGWVEQGGTLPAQATVTATLPIEMSDNNYQVLLTGGPFAPTTSDIRVKYVQTRTTTSFTASANSSIAYMWQVSGIAQG